MKKILMATIALACLTACHEKQQNSEEKIIDKPDFAAEAGTPFSIEALEALGRVSSPVASPDGTRLLFSVSYESVEDNASNADLYVLPLNEDSAEPRRITRTPKSESNAVWIQGGEKIAFLYPDSDGKPQIWEIGRAHV